MYLVLLPLPRVKSDTEFQVIAYEHENSRFYEQQIEGHSRVVVQYNTLLSPDIEIHTHLKVSYEDAWLPVQAQFQ